MGKTMRIRDVKPIVDVLPKGECQRRWKEGRMSVVCGHPMPCPAHGGEAPMTVILNTDLPDPNEYCRLDVEKIIKTIWGSRLFEAPKDNERVREIVKILQDDRCIEYSPEDIKFERPKKCAKLEPMTFDKETK